MSPQIVREGCGFSSRRTGWSRNISRARWQIHIISEFLTTSVFAAFVFRTLSSRCTTSSRLISLLRAPAGPGEMAPPNADVPSAPGDVIDAAGMPPTDPTEVASGLSPWEAATGRWSALPSPVAGVEEFASEIEFLPTPADPDATEAADDTASART